MRVATLNVEAGGFEGYVGFEPHHPPRLEAIQEAVAGLDADVVGLTDTFQWHNLYSAADLRAMFEYAHALPVQVTRDHIGMTLLSRRELVHASPIIIGDRQALRADIEQDDSSILRLFVAYLYHGREHIREAEAASLLAQAAPLDALPTTVMGDLNTVDRKDKLTAIGRHLIRLIPQDSHYRIREVSSLMEGRTYQRFIDAGLNDANQKRRPTFPTPKLKLLGGLAVPTAFRLDHILHTPNISITDCFVPGGAIYRSASDHYPLVADVA